MSSVAMHAILLVVAFLSVATSPNLGSPATSRDTQLAQDLVSFFRGLYQERAVDSAAQEPLQESSEGNIEDDGGSLHETRSITAQDIEYSTSCKHIMDLRNEVEGELSSVNFPYEYPSSVDECWLIGGVTKVTTIQFDRHFDLEESYACVYDLVSFYQQGSHEPRFGPYCGDTPPEDISMFGEVLVVFQTDESDNFTGFSLTFTAEASSDIECSLSQGRGSVTSPNYGYTYPDNYHACWILGDRFSFVEISFEKMRIEDHPSCSNDYLKFYVLNPRTARFELEDTLCGSQTPDDLYFPVGPVKVDFRTDESRGATGFKFEYIDFAHEDCEPLDSDGGQVSISWREYGINMTLCWALLTDVGDEVEIIFSEFDVLTGYKGVCYENEDYVRIIDGTGQDEKYCNQNLPPDSYISTSGIVVIEFVTSNTETGGGFMLTYTVNGVQVADDGRASCHVLNRERGGIKTPNYPRGYQPNTHICWEIHSPSGRPVVVNFERIGMQESYGCEDDYIMLHNGTIAHDHPLGRYCLSRLIMPPPAMGGFMTVEFFSNSDEHVGPGVFLWYRTLDEGEEWGYTEDGDGNDDLSSEDEDDEYLGGNESEGTPDRNHPACRSSVTMDGDTGRITFISDPANPVEANLRCRWKIRASEGKRLLFSFKKVELPEAPYCELGSVKLVENRRYIGGVCGDRVKEMFSWENYVELEFRSIEEFPTRGFILTYKTFEYDPSIEIDRPPCGIADQERPHASASTRVVGGIPAMSHDWPWMVHLQVDGMFLCGGSILHDVWILTAVHCVEGYTSHPEKYSVVIGEHDLRVFEGEEIVYGVEEIICHPDYHELSLMNDVCLLRLSTQIRWNRHVSPVCITPDSPPVGANAYATGWGDAYELSDNNVLQEVELRILDSDMATAWLSKIVYEMMIAAGWEEGTKDTCQGDSGGPLVVKRGKRWFLVGVTSWGMKCAARRQPGVYARVSYFTDWIRTHTDGDVEPLQ